MTGLRKISFIAHSLGGLFARYAISILYSPKAEETGSSTNVMPTTEGSEMSRLPPGLGTIAGLEPINFITLATPHLGVRGKNQVGLQHALIYICQPFFYFRPSLGALEANALVLIFMELLVTYKNFMKWTQYGVVYIPVEGDKAI
jgi:hypothetical protein